MKTATYKFVQNDLLKGMTSYLKDGACWGLSVRWLQECFLKGPHLAGYAITQAETAYEAILSHAKYANGFLSGEDDDVSIETTIVMLSGGTMIAERSATTNTGGHNSTAVSLICAMDAKPNYFGLIVFTCPKGRHAMAVTNNHSKWTLFDPNFGTWVFPCDSQGAPTNFSSLLVENFSHYSVTEVKLFTITKIA